MQRRRWRRLRRSLTSAVGAGAALAPSLAPPLLPIPPLPPSPLHSTHRLPPSPLSSAPRPLHIHPDASAQHPETRSGVCRECRPRRHPAWRLSPALFLSFSVSFSSSPFPSLLRFLHLFFFNSFFPSFLSSSFSPLSPSPSFVRVRHAHLSSSHANFSFHAEHHIQPHAALRQSK